MITAEKMDRQKKDLTQGFTFHFLLYFHIILVNDSAAYRLNFNITFYVHVGYTSKLLLMKTKR